MRERCCSERFEPFSDPLGGEDGVESVPEDEEMEDSIV